MILINPLKNNCYDEKSDYSINGKTVICSITENLFRRAPLFLLGKELRNTFIRRRAENIKIYSQDNNVAILKEIICH